MLGVVPLLFRLDGCEKEKQPLLDVGNVGNLVSKFESKSNLLFERILEYDVLLLSLASEKEILCSSIIF